MKDNKTIKILISVVAVTVITITITTLHIQGQKQSAISNQAREQIQGEDKSQFPVVDYQEQESPNADEREKRRLKNKRYDKDLQ